MKWVLFMIAWLPWSPFGSPQVTVEGMFDSQERCHEQASRTHAFFGSGGEVKTELRCKRVDVDEKLRDEVKP